MSSAATQQHGFPCSHTCHIAVQVHLSIPVTRPTTTTEQCLHTCIHACYVPGPLHGSLSTPVYIPAMWWPVRHTCTLVSSHVHNKAVHTHFCVSACCLLLLALGSGGVPIHTPAQSHCHHMAAQTLLFVCLSFPSRAAWQRITPLHAPGMS